MFATVPGRDLRRRSGWRLKERVQRAGTGQAGREGDFAIASRTPDIARAAAGWRTCDEFGRVAEPSLASSGDRAPRASAPSAAPLLAALALSACAAVGPNFERPAALVSPEFKEIKGWKIATPREGEPKGEWWSVFHDPELDRLDAGSSSCPTRRSRRTKPIIAQALALINEARAGLFPTVNGTGSADRSSPSVTTLTAEASGSWTLDIWGQVRREVEAQQAGARSRAPPLSPTRRFPSNRCWRSPM